MKNFIIGAGGHGRVILDILNESGLTVAGFLDDDKSLQGTVVDGVSVLGDTSFLERCVEKEKAVVVGIGDNLIRARLIRKVRSWDVELISAVHPRAIISKNIQLGRGIAIMGGAVINTGTVVEEGVVVNTGATVDHDCVLKKFSQIWPGANIAGGVIVGEYAYVGTGAAVIQNIKIGKNATIGAGAAVLEDVPENAIAVGVPAKVIKYKASEE